MIELTVLDAFEVQQWEKTSLNPSSLISALRQTGAKFAAKAVAKADEGQFRDLAGAATGFFARANDMELSQSIGSASQQEPQAVTIETGTSSPRDRVLALLKA
jgi:hypothetical protein